MEKKYWLVIVYVVLIIALIMSLCYIFDPNKTKLGELYKSLYEPLDYSINVIETNMNEIAVSDDDWNWAELKETDTEDKQLKKTYSLLVSDIRTCYLLSTDLKNKTYDNIKILSFKNKRNITEKQLIQLSENENCLEIFDKYNSLTLSDYPEISEKMKKQISIIIDYKSEPAKNQTFIDILNEESINTSKVAALTKWLKIEYYSHKNE